jgi:uncharacterized protein YkwD
MTPTILRALAVTAVLFGAGTASACDRPGNLGALQSGVIAGVNAARKSAGLNALAASDALQAAAQKHACDIAARDQLSHTGSNGSSVSGRIKSEGYRFRVANENVAVGSKGPDGAVAQWMGSPPHRANILKSGTREIGVGVAVARDGSQYWVMVSAGRK